MPNHIAHVTFSTMFNENDYPHGQVQVNYAEELNPAQYEAATFGEGPILVIAGAGSGKTRTLVYRMAHLIERGISPESILLLTFTRRAAQEMLARAGQLVGQNCQRVMGGTFHATANILLRQNGHHIGINSNFNIIDRSDSESIINLLKSSLGMAGAGKKFPSKSVIMNLISGEINKSTPIEELVNQSYNHFSQFIDDFIIIKEEYSKFKEEHALLDYDDLLVNWQRLLMESPRAAEEICSRFQYILVDEYQDTNLIQAEIVRLMANKHENVMVVGDDSQSIYSFRGADFYNIIRFPDLFNNTKIVKLEQNYRSSQPILRLTNDLINQASNKYSKTLFSDIESDISPILHDARTESGEARFVVEKIKKLISDGLKPQDIAVLFRSGYHSYKLEMELTSQGFKFDKRGGMKLTESAHIKDMLSFLRVLLNPWDNISWNRILLQLDKVGPKTAQKIIRTIGESDNPLQALQGYPAASGWKQGFNQLKKLFSRLIPEKMIPADLFTLVLDYYGPILEKIYYDDYPRRRKELEQLLTIVETYSNLQSFLDDTTLDPPESNALDSDLQEEKITLSTIHSAKGLEWQAVFVIGLAEGRFPHQKTIPGSEEWEEERRLLYVAATRAKEQLYLSWPRQIIAPDRSLKYTMLSPFIREINPALYYRPQQEEKMSTYSGNSHGGHEPASSFKVKKKTSARQDFSPGMEVIHPVFGPGIVKSIPDPRRVIIAFKRHGNKTLHLDYAKLEVIK